MTGATNRTLECRDLTVAYGDHVAVDSLSFSVGRGEIFGLLGPNGAGKTSVIRALTTILTPRAGTASVAGADLGDAAAVRRRIGVLPESSGYPRAQTGLQFLRFYGELFGLTAAEASARAEALLGQFGLGATTARISHYSRGMRQRLGLCRAMVNRPQVLFLDEPTLGLDPGGKEEVVRHLADMAAAEGTTIVLCTHLLDEVERVCDRVAILDHGRLVAAGTVDEVTALASPDVAARLQVRGEDVPDTTLALQRLELVTGVTFDNARPGDLLVTLAGDGTRSSEQVLRAVLDEGVDILGFDYQRASLTDAFLALTRSGGEAA